MKQRWLIWLFVFVALDARAQNDARSAARRTTVGVALEGGGAKGLAHIGVLRWFEEHHIPVDYIAGTSMGGLVAGLYATGYSPAEIEQIISGIDWDQVLAGQTRYQDLSFRRKEDLRALPNYLELGLRHGVSLPGGLNSGQAVSLIIDKYLLPYSEPKSFDDLPIPFRCVATDLVSGKPEVFASGSIVNALRATMSIPGVFAPVRAGTKIYADGGLLNNLPTDVLKKMGPDVAIGVHLSVGPTDPSQLRTLLQVAGGSTGVMIDANVLHGMELADLLLTIDVAGFTTMQFSRSASIIPKGYEAAQAREVLLDRLRLSDKDWNRYMAGRESRKVAIVSKANFVEVQGVGTNLSLDIEKRFGGYVGQPIDTKGLERDIGELQGEGRFDSITYSLAQRNGETGLLITAQEKGYAPPFLKPGFTVDGADPDNVGFTLAARVTFLDLGGYRSELRADFAFGSKYGIGVEYYHPFTPRTRWFVAPQFSAARTPLNLYSKNNLLAEYRENTVNGGVDIGYGFDRFSELRIGYSAGYLDAVRRNGLALLPSVSGRTGAARVRYALDHLDNPIIPRHGIALLSDAKWVDANPGAKSGFPLADTTIEAFFPVSKPSSVYAIADGGTTFGHSQTGLPAFSLGSPARLAAYGIDEILTNQYYYFRLGYLHRLATLPAFLGRGLYLDAHYEIAKPFGGLSSSRLPNDGVLGIVVQTIFGPMTVGESVGDRGHQKWFFQLGKIY
jgi:NTE family protein